MENQNLWQHGYCRVPNALCETISIQKKAQTMGVMLWCIAKAQRVDGIVNGVSVKRGQVCTTVKDMAETLGMTYGQMRTTLDALVDASVIALEAKHIGRSSCTLITITDYDSYNGYRRFEDTADGNAANNAQSERQCNAQSTRQSECLNLNEENIKKEKEMKKEEKKIKSFDFGIPVSELKDWFLSQTIWADAYMMNHHLSADELEKWIQQFVIYLQSCGIESKHGREAMAHFSNWHAKRKEAAYEAERKRVDELTKQRTQMEEHRSMERIMREKQKAEQDAITMRNMMEIRRAAENGDAYAQEILDKYGVWECENGQWKRIG